MNVGLLKFECNLDCTSKLPYIDPKENNKVKDYV
jgi:hypothetical protein